MKEKSQADDAKFDSLQRYHLPIMATGGDECRLQPSDSHESDHKEPHEASYCNPEFLIIQLSSCTSSMCVTG